MSMGALPGRAAVVLEGCRVSVNESLE